jgi:hypothetical protein
LQGARGAWLIRAEEKRVFPQAAIAWTGHAH